MWILWFLWYWLANVGIYYNRNSPASWRIRLESTILADSPWYWIRWADMYGSHRSCHLDNIRSDTEQHAQEAFNGHYQIATTQHKRRKPAALLALFRQRTAGLFFVQTDFRSLAVIEMRR